MAKLTMVSRTVGDILTDEIENIVNQFPLNIFEDRKQQQTLQNELNNNLPLGKWQIVATNNLIRITLTGRNNTRAIWNLA